MTERSLSAMARQLYVDGPWLMRRMQWYRPYICPFHILLPWVPIGASVLDVGCGGGLFLGLLAKTRRIGRGFGFDSSTQAIATAQRMAERLAAVEANAKSTAAAGVIPIFEHRDVSAPWPEEQFDVVTLIDVMHHVPKSARRSLLELLAARVRPGGRLIYKDMCLRPLWRAWANRAHDLVLARQWIHPVSVEWVETTLAEMQLSTIYRSPRIDMLWYGHELRVFEKPIGDQAGSAIGV